MQAGPVEQQLVSGADAAERRGRHRRRDARSTETGLVLADGREVELDVLIFGTGLSHAGVRGADAHRGPRRPHAAGRLERRAACLARARRARVPEHVPDLRPQHVRRLGVGHLHDREPDAPRRRGRPRAAPHRRARHRGARRRARRVHGRAARAPAAHGVGDRRLLELVRRRAGPRPHQLARLHARVPAPHDARVPRRVHAGAGAAGRRRSSGATRRSSSAATRTRRRAIRRRPPAAS